MLWSWPWATIRKQLCNWFDGQSKDEISFPAKSKERICRRCCWCDKASSRLRWAKRYRWCTNPCWPRRRWMPYHPWKSGVKAILKREKPWLLFVWCFAHRLELANDQGCLDRDILWGGGRLSVTIFTKRVQRSWEDWRLSTTHVMGALSFLMVESSKEIKWDKVDWAQDQCS